eukprot:280227_1
MGTVTANKQDTGYDEKSDKPSSSKSLQKMKFPENFNTIYKSIPNYAQQLQYTKEKIMQGDPDSRKCYDTNEVTALSRIGQLCMLFNTTNNNEAKGFGTATIFYHNPNTKRMYAITCAHNLLHYDAWTDSIWTLKSMWFDRRLTNNYKIYSSSKSIKRYIVDETWSHPKYDPKRVLSGFDLAIISFIDDDQYFTQNLNNMNIVKTFTGYPEEKSDLEEKSNNSKSGYADRVQRYILTNNNATDFDFLKSFIVAALPYCVNHSGYSLFGYPGDKNGELWGEQISKNEANKKLLDVRKNGDMITYTIHTKGGQSGSAIIYSCKDSFKIVAIHVTGNDQKNFGVLLTESKIKWIVQCIKQIENGNEIESNKIVHLLATQNFDQLK